MPPPARYRKVLIVEDEPSIRGVMYTLLAALRCDSDVAANGREALAKISQEEYDAVLLDLRCADLVPEEVLAQIQDLRPNLVGRVLVITAEVADPKIAELIERYFLLRIPDSRLKQDLLGVLMALLIIPPQSQPAR